MSDAPVTDKIISRKDGAVCWLIFNQPEKRNAVSLDMTAKALEVIQDFAKDDSLRVLMVRGAGDKAFVSGADISEFEKRRNSAEAAEEYAKISRQMYDTLYTVEKPTVAMIHGYCFGGGVALAASCDIRICADDGLFSIPAARLGIGYSFNFTKRVADLVGPACAKEMLYTARRYPAEEAYAMGFVNRVLPKAELDAYGEEYAETIAGNAPLSIRATKVVVNQLVKDPADRDMKRCDEMIAACADSQDFAEARRAFMEKRKPTFAGR